MNVNGINRLGALGALGVVAVTGLAARYGAAQMEIKPGDGPGIAGSTTHWKGVYLQFHTNDPSGYADEHLIRAAVKRTLMDAEIPILTEAQWKATPGHPQL